MREIKFKAWNTRRKEMEICHDLYWFEENFVNENGDGGYILLQYTGLKDKNEKEIYEGDILKFDRFYNVVKFGNYEEIDEKDYAYIRAGFYIENKDGSTATINPKYYEVVGNIYENPELLKEEI